MGGALISDAKAQCAPDALFETERLSAIVAQFGSQSTKAMLLSVLDEADFLASRIHSSLKSGDLNTAGKNAYRLKEMAAKWAVSRLADTASAVEADLTTPKGAKAATKEIAFAIACVRAALYGRAAPGFEGDSRCCVMSLTS